MTELVLSAILGIVFFLGFLVLGLIGRPQTALDSPPMNALRQIVDLPGLSTTNADVLFAPSDYQILRSRAKLRQLASQLRQDRRRILLSWLRLLVADVRTLWRFRRFLVRNGVSVGFLEELQIAATATSALLALFGLEILVACAGPFALYSLIASARRQVEKASCLCADLLHRLPSNGLVEIERKWAEGSL